LSTILVDKISKILPEGDSGTMKLELDIWRELWDRAGSRGLVMWYELPETVEDEAESDLSLAKLVDKDCEGG